jgi:hypothetical protein
MPRREILIRSVLMFPVDREFGPKDEQSRAHELKVEFSNLVPSLQRLQGSQFICKRKPKPDGLHLELILLEAPRQSVQDLWSDSQLPPRAPDAKFRSDLASVSLDLAQLPNHLQQSLSAGTDLLNILDSSDQGSIIRTFRKALRRSSHLSHLIQPELPLVSEQAPPHVLPLGYRVEVKAQIHDIKKCFVRLKEVSFIGDVPEALMSAELGTYLNVLRPPYRSHADFNQYLLESLDKSNVVTFNLIAAFRWRDGYPVHFEFEQISVEKATEDVHPSQ